MKNQKRIEDLRLLEQLLQVSHLTGDDTLRKKITSKINEVTNKIINEI